MTNKIYCKYWGKSRLNEETGANEWHPLVYHSLDVAAVAWVWLEKEPQIMGPLKDLFGNQADADFANLITFIISLHDLGKFADSFQGLNQAARSRLGKTDQAPAYNVRHDSLGYLFWKKEFLMKKSWGGVFEGVVPSELWFNFHGVSEKSELSEVLSLLLQASTGHHGRPPSQTNYGKGPISLDSHFMQTDIEAGVLYAKEVYSFLAPKLPPVTAWGQTVEALRPLTFWLAGFAVVCDWIGSNADIFHYREACDLSLREYFEKVASINAALGLEQSGVLSASAAKFSGFENLFDYLKNATPLQVNCAEKELSSEPCLHILEDVTGAGKTEAAMVLAQRQMRAMNLRGFYIGLPTMATANGMYARMYKYYRNLYAAESKPSLVLAHGAKNMNDKFQNTILTVSKIDSEYAAGEDTATALCTAWIADSSKKSLLGDAGIGTIDQSLLSVLRCKFQTLRLFGLMHKVLILDEVHAYDSYMNELICNLLEAQARIGAPVILLSATLPFSLRERFCKSYAAGLGAATMHLAERTSYPLMTQVSKEKVTETPIETRVEVRRTVAVKFTDSEDALIALIDQAVSKGHCVCWIRNTVGDAIQSYELLKSRYAEKLLLFHARFAMGDRLSIENSVLRLFGKEGTTEERSGRILIATQVVEQSLDLDFDLMITDLAPIDLVIQRAGRLHRHQRGPRDKPILWVHTPSMADEPEENWYYDKFRGASFVYPNHGQLWLTAKYLAEKKQWKMPEDAREMIEYVYSGHQEIPDALQGRDEAARNKENIRESMATQNSLNFAMGYTAEGNDADWDDLNAPSRYSEDRSVKVTLAKIKNGVCVPWFEGEKYAWQNSELSVMPYILAAEDESASEDVREAIKRAKETMPSRGKYTTVLVLTPEGNFCSGYGKDRFGKRIKLLYSRETGLQKVKE